MYQIGHKNVDELAAEYGTPLFAYDEEVLRDRLASYVKYFRSEEFRTGVIYASKAFSCKAMIRLLSEYGLYLDAVSAGEIYTAYKAGFDMKKVFFHGNNKSLAELELAADLGVGNIVIDNAQEAECLAAVLEEKNTDMHVLLRVNPGIEAHTHKYIVTAHVDSKFGVALAQEEEVIRTIDIIRSSGHMVFDGLHSHIGSQIFDKQAYIELAVKLFAFAGKLRDVYGIETDTIDFGGGFAAVYTAADTPIPLDEVCSTILNTSTEENRKLGGLIKNLYIEPGRSVVAEAGYTLYTAGYIKKTPNRHYVFVDGGMSDNIRPALYQAEYDLFAAGKEDLPKTETYTIAGKCCESGDILIDSIALPEIKTGDILVMKTTGAYGYAMSSRYNKLPGPAVVFVKDGKAREVIRRQTYDDIIALED